MEGECLDGIRVLDFTWWGAGPRATKILADFGAEVIKVESRKRIDNIRVSEPYRWGKADVNASGLFLHGSTSKYSITLDLGQPKGVEVAKRLVGLSDVVAENFSPGTMGRMGLGYEQIRAIKPDIIMLSSSCLGQAGVYSDLRGHALVGAALSGHYYMTGYPDGEPTSSASAAYADAIQPYFSVIAVMSAMEHRRRTGEGQWIDITQIETMASFLPTAYLELEANRTQVCRAGNRNPSAAPHGAFLCQGEDRWIAIAVFTDQEWQGLCRAMGEPEWCREERFSTTSGRKAHEDELERLISVWTQTQVAEEAMELLQRHGVGAGVVQDPKDVLEHDPQVEARGTYVRLQHPVCGECRHPVPPVKLSLTPAQVETAPLLGEHNSYVYTELLGMPDQEFAELLNQGVFE